MEVSLDINFSSFMLITPCAQAHTRGRVIGLSVGCLFVS